jgi:hypothetical protein
MRSKTMEDFERALAPAVSRLGLQEVERDDPDMFDNGLVVYQKDWIRVRLIVDRGFRSVELSSVHTPDVWVDLQPMINRAWNRDGEHVPMPDEFASFLGENFETLRAGGV